MPVILAVSPRVEDIAFCKEIVRLTGMDTFSISKPSELKSALEFAPDAVIFWDIDHPSATVASHPLSIQSVTSVLTRYSSPARTFVISDNPLNTMPYIFNTPIFNHHIYRKFQPPTPALIARLIITTLGKGVSAAIEQYFPKNYKIQKITISHSRERRAVVDAVGNVLQKLKTPSRVNLVTAQAVDELLMNAIFDAPMVDGEYYRAMIDRNERFPLEPWETVDLELGFSKSYFCICVRDQFGSMKTETFLKSIRKNYTGNNYKVDHNSPSAGLGLYGILQCGLSLLYRVEPGYHTKAFIFVPLVKNMRSLKKSFRFFSVS